jgi:segregation and condensation protein A
VQINYHLDVFDGPLDLLMQLISKNKINIYDIPIAEICEQYNEALRQMEALDLNVTCDFIAMSAHLLYIKSRMLLPKPEEETEAEDPRAQLVEMLLEYQRFKEISGVFHSRSEFGSNIFIKKQEQLELDKKYRYVHTMDDLKQAVLRLLDRVENRLPPPVSSFEGIVGREVYSVAAKTVSIVKRLIRAGILSFKSLFNNVKSRSEVVATFLAVLELCKSNRIQILDENDETAIKLTLER